MAKNCKYQKYQKYISYDNGATWQPMQEFQKGELIEASSTDCGGGTVVYQWVVDSYYCNNSDRYATEKKQVSYNNGQSWEDVAPAETKSTLVERNSSYCGSYQYRWVESGTTCIGYDKWQNNIRQVSRDGGQTWVNVSPPEYSASTVIEYNSEDCGYVPPTPVGGTKWAATYSGGTYLTGECDSTSAITSQNCPPNYNGNNPCIELAVGDCVTTIRIQSWSQGQFMYVSSVTLSNSVTTLDVGAFEHFSGLTSIVIPDSVTTIGDLAFYLCTSLSSVTIGSGVTSIGDASFNRCNLDEITIPNNVVTIGEQAFCNSGIKSATIGSGVTSIGGDAFSQNPNLSSVTITALVPPTLESYGVFDYTNDCPIMVPCDSLSVYKSTNRWSDYSSRIVGIPPCGEIQYRWYPSGTTCIGYDKYQNNIKQKSEDNGETWTNVSPPEYSASTLIEYNSEDCGYVPPTPVGGTKWAATYSDSHTESAECDSTSAITENEIELDDLVSVEIGSCVTSIGSHAFLNADELTGITIPDNVTSIGDMAFRYCNNLSSVTIGDGVTIIYPYAFDSCGSLTSVTIGNSVQTIGGWAFSHNWYLSSVTIPDSVTTIGGGAFSEDLSLTNVTIGSGVTSIGDLAFSGSSSLTSVTIEATTPPSLGSRVFDDTASNLVIYVPCASVDAYKSAWNNLASRIHGIPPCESPTPTGTKWVAYYPSGTTSAQCDSSSAITSGEIDLSGLTSVTINDCVTTIGNDAFYLCRSLSSVTMPNSVTSIGEYAFQECAFSSFIIPESVTSINDSAFYGCTSLTSITIPSGVTSINDQTFVFCTRLSSVTIPNSVTSIGTSAFMSCGRLTNITIPSGVTSIGYQAFHSCYYLDSVTILAQTPPSLGNNAFLNTSRNLVIYVPQSSLTQYQSASGWEDLTIQPIPNS